MSKSFVLAIAVTLVPFVAGAATPSPAPVPPAAAAPPSAQASPVSSRLAGVAPADAYFGPFGMSPLSMRSTIGLLGREYHYRTISDHDLLRKALLTEDAMRLWRSKYPSDPWLAPTFYHLEQLYQAVQTDEAHKHATAILKDVVRNYPTSKEGHLSRARLAAGFPPLIAETPLISPSPSAASLPSPGAGSDAATAPDSSPAPSATPAAMPVAAPASSSAPNV